MFGVWLDGLIGKMVWYGLWYRGNGGWVDILSVDFWWVCFMYWRWWMVLLFDFFVICLVNDCIGFNVDI